MRRISHFEARCISNVEPTPVDWLWENRFARGKVNVVAGEPGLGKSQMTCFIAAVTSKGGMFPDGTTAPPGNVILISCEDDAGDTIRPRLEAAGANLENIWILDWSLVQNEDTTSARRTFSIRDDSEKLDQFAHELGGVCLIIIDPVSAYFGKVDSHKNADVRAALAPLQAVAAKMNACVVLVSHLNKGTIDGSAMSRVAGSSGIVAAARSAWVVARHPNCKERRIITPLKNNLGDDETGFSYTIEGVELCSGIKTSRVVLDPDPVFITPEEALGPRKQSDEPQETSLGEAIEFLKGELIEGERWAKELMQLAEDAGLARRTVERAKKALKVKASKLGNRWSWSLPPVSDDPDG